jgi:hypothetical protein
MLERSNLGDGLKITIIMNQQQIVFQCRLGNTTIDRATHGQPFTPQIVIDPRRRLPRMIIGFDIVLIFKIRGKEIPLPIIQRTLQEFKLGKAGEQNSAIGNHNFKFLADLAATIAENADLTQTDVSISSMMSFAECLVIKVGGKLDLTRKVKQVLLATRSHKFLKRQTHHFLLGFEVGELEGFVD